MICAFCDRSACEGLTAVAACDRHRDDPERAGGVLLECAGALANLMEDPSSERNRQFAEIALERWRAMNVEPAPAAAGGSEEVSGDA